MLTIEFATLDSVLFLIHTHKSCNDKWHGFLTFWPWQVLWSHICIFLIKSSEEVTTTYKENKDDKLFSGPFCVSTINGDIRSSYGRSCIKRDSTFITARQVNDLEIDLKEHEISNTDNESTTFLYFPNSIMEIKRYSFIHSFKERFIVF